MGIVYGKVRYIDGEGRAIGEVDTGPTDHEEVGRPEPDLSAGSVFPSFRNTMPQEGWILPCTT